MDRQLLFTTFFLPLGLANQWGLAIFELDRYIQHWYFSEEYAPACDNLHDEANRRQNY